MIRRPLLHRIRRIVAILFWPAVLLAIWGQLTPRPPSPVEVNDKLAHFAAYCLLAAMASAAAHRRSIAVAAVVGLFLMGAGIEILQGYVGRDMSGWDLLADTAGILTGAIGARVIVERLYRGFAEGDRG